MAHSPISTQIPPSLMTASLTTFSEMMDISPDFACRNVFVDDWDSQIQRLHRCKKDLFDDQGTFEVLLIRIGELKVHIRKG
jgi:hypothetical protein